MDRHKARIKKNPRRRKEKNKVRKPKRLYKEKKFGRVGLEEIR